MHYSELWDSEPNPSSAVISVTIKLSRDQLAHIEASGEATSQWVREAVDMRLDQEGIQGS